MRLVELKEASPGQAEETTVQSLCRGTELGKWEEWREDGCGWRVVSEGEWCGVKWGREQRQDQSFVGWRTVLYPQCT